MIILPQDIDEWLEELARAYIDAQETIPFGDLIGTTITEEQLFHLTPLVAIKFRGLRQTRTNIRKAAEAALSTYVANKDREGLPMNDHLVAFALCYLASHFGLGLLSGEETEQILLQVETKRDELLNTIQTYKQPAG